ncbi:hypothetical protein FSARC_7280 [Fusarium sarcochroum]|uniref:Heterokaryon incompatibility domain-containing protein n=1 Tax=Fusarium sarcochroum TaxID=1208366 RepID=A0A8H4TVM8_9HYPO|nr:hypothetical protein FSARC_7280 [Fusarium sarcochroum]
MCTSKVIPCIDVVPPPPFQQRPRRSAKWEFNLRDQIINLDAPLPSEPEDHSDIIKRFNSRDLDSELVELTTKVIQPWMDKCQQNHPKCNETPWHSSPNYPKRLIFVGNKKDHSIKLIETGAECPPYLILSYCWGTSNNCAKTTRSNYESRKKMIYLSELSRTIRDAIKLTRTMEEEYLWIDALCIEQADDGHTGDWEIEAPKVGDYYANAKCLISAMSASESNEGFLTERMAWRYPQRYSLITHSETICNSGRICYWLVGPEQDLELECSREPLAKRGWCLQEKFLCPRRLHWTKNGLFWECNTLMTSESEALSSSNPIIHGVRPEMEVIRTDDRSTALGLGWGSLISDYSGRKLTVESDRFPAIHGLATRLAQYYEDVYYAGVFGSKLAYTLMYTYEPGARKVSFFPSWSWAAARGAVSWRDYYDSRGIVSRVELVSFPPSSLMTDFTKFSSRELRIKVPLIKIFTNGTYKTDSLGWDSEPPVQVEISETADHWVPLDLASTASFWVEFDHGSDAEPKQDEPMPILLAAVLLLGQETSLNGIILKKTTEGGNEAYTREGVFRIDRVDRNIRTLDDNIDKNTMADGTRPTELAVMGFFVLEWYRLSDLTGDPQYGELVTRAEEYWLTPLPRSGQVEYLQR